MGCAHGLPGVGRAPCHICGSRFQSCGILVPAQRRLCLCSIPSEGQSYGGRENRPTDQDWLARDRERQCLWPIRKCRYCDTYNWSLGKGHNIRSSKEKRRHMAIRNATSGDIWRTAADRPFARASEASGRTIKGRAVARVSAGDKGCPDD
jgi:hypothetical protein